VAAGVSKGAFFHHFRSKEDLAVAAAEFWSTMTSAFFATAPYHALPDPVDRLLGYVQFRKSIVQGELAAFTCLVGTMVQETFESCPAIRDACERSISGHAAVVQQDIEAAMKLYRIKADWTASSLALHMQAVIQGAFILAKARHSRSVAVDSIGHLHRYLESLFPQRKTVKKKKRSSA
jgi:TetR/AcrR family transcriptional repressor of nem operon